jgi:hypothetical protein
MEHRRSFGLGSTVLSLLLAASAVGAGCSSGDTPSAADTGVGDAASSDGSTVQDTGPTGDRGGNPDVGPVGDAGGATDGGSPTDTGMTDTGATDASGTDAGRADGGPAGRPHAGASLVSAGSLMRSSGFQMVSTLGGRSVQQTTLQSPNYRLRGGLVGTIGAR